MNPADLPEDDDLDTAAQPFAADAALPPWEPELALDTLSTPADWSAVFERTAPLVMEIGCGGGRTIMGMAAAHPEWNCIAVERAGEYFRLMRARAIKRRMPNLRISRTDAAYLVNRFVADRSIAEYHIYFSDPWPKKKHRKRRLFQEAFCADIARTLAADGVLYVASDHHDYYHEDILPRLQAVLDVEVVTGPWPDAPQGRTNYEVKYILAGRPIYRMIGRVRGDKP